MLISLTIQASTLPTVTTTTPTTTPMTTGSLTVATTTAPSTQAVTTASGGQANPSGDSASTNTETELKRYLSMLCFVHPYSSSVTHKFDSIFEKDF